MIKVVVVMVGGGQVTGYRKAQVGATPSRLPHELHHTNLH